MKTHSALKLIFLITLFAGFSLAQAGDWVGTWGCAPQLVEPKNMPPAPGLGGNTLRQIVQVSVGGTKLRVKFSNDYGTSTVLMISAFIAESAGKSAIQISTEAQLTFNGSPVVTINAGESVWSDPVNFNLAPLADVAVTTRFADMSAALTGHPGSRTTSYLQTGEGTMAANLSGAATMAHWYILNTIDVQADNPGGAIVTLGDSITDGRGSGTDKNDRWPDDLEKRVLADKNTANVAMLNMGIGGNCVLNGGLGPTALSRFDRDVLSQSDPRWVIVFEGVNDIGGSQDLSVASNLISAYHQFIVKAHAHNLRIYGATITPFGGSFYDSPIHEQARQIVNGWIRHSGEFDAVIDFDAAVRDPQNLAHLLPANDSGDHLHPNEHGYHVMADAVDLALFQK